MTQYEARRILERYEAGLLSWSDRKAVIDAVTIALLRAAVNASDGRVSFSLEDISVPRIAQQ